MILYYNIHNIFKIKVVSNHKSFLEYIDREFSSFKTSKFSNPDLIVSMGDFKPDITGASIVNHKYFIKNNFLYCKDSYKVAKWKVQINGLDSKKTFIKIFGNRFSLFFIVSYIIEPMMRFKLNKKGYTFLHSSAISDGKNAILFSACKGVGKTSTILNLISRGFLYMSDDFTILSNKGVVFSYPTTIHMFGYNVKHCPFIYEKLSSKEKRKIRLNDLIFKLSFNYVSLPLYVNAKDMFSGGEIGSSYPLKELIFFVKSNGREIKIEKNYDKKKVIQQMISINKMEMFNFLEYMLAYTSIFPENDFTSHWYRLYENLMKALDKKPITKITIPKKFPKRIIDYVMPR